LPPEVLGPDWVEVQLNQIKSARPADILEYYFRSRQSRPLNEAKLILVGRGGAGKTSLVNRLLHGGFDKDERKTPGISITPWELALGDEKVQLNIWDFGGQEIMHATHQFFLTERSLYLLVVNAREGEQDANIEYWLRLIESFGAQSPVLVVINKVKDHPFDLNRRGLQEKFPAIRGFIQTDCEDATGIEELQRAIERETDRLEHLRDPFPASWFSIKRHLSNMEKNFISYEEYQAECRTLGVEEAHSQETLVGFLHCLGIVLNFKDDPRLADTHVLNPEWVTGGVYKILNAEKLVKSGGILRMADLRTILPTADYPRRTHAFVMDFMRKFELCFHFEDGHERFLIPELLGKEEPPLNEFDDRDALRFEYHYNILPEGLLPRFIVRTHEMSSGQPRWRTGVVLEYEGNQASIKADVQDRKVFIAVIGPPAGRRRLLSIIRSHFDHIHRSVARLEATEMVPITSNARQVIPYRDLLVIEENGREKLDMVVDSALVEVDITAVLNGIETKQQRENRNNKKVGIEPKTLVYSYSHKDEALRDELETHLSLLKRQGVLSIWHDRKILPGYEWVKEIDENFKTADIILLLVSADFIASDYCWDIEVKEAMRRHEAKEAHVIPIILRDCDWSSAPFGKLQGLPRDGKPITLWPDKDTAWKDVAVGIRRIV
jgi:internalin A